MKIEQRRIQGDDGLVLFTRRTAHPEGRGVPIVCCNGVGVSTVFWTYIERDFCAGHPVICWDYRVHGESEAVSDFSDLSIERNADDLRAVLDGHGVDRAVLLGHSMGVQVILEFERRYPERVAALVPMLGTYGRPIHTFFDQPVVSLIGFRLVHQLVLKRYESINRSSAALFTKPVVRGIAGRLARLAGIVNAELMPVDKLDAYLHHMSRLDIRVFARMAEKMAFHSVEDRLSEIAAPTLVVAATKDYFTPLWLSEEMADRIPNAELLIIPGGSHAALVEHPELISLRLRAFLGKVQLGSPTRAGNPVLTHGASNVSAPPGAGYAMGNRPPRGP